MALASLFIRVIWVCVCVRETVRAEPKVPPHMLTTCLAAGLTLPPQNLTPSRYVLSLQRKNNTSSLISVAITNVLTKQDYSEVRTQRNRENRSP